MFTVSLYTLKWACKQIYAFSQYFSAVRMLLRPAHRHTHLCRDVWSRTSSEHWPRHCWLPPKQLSPAGPVPSHCAGDSAGKGVECFCHGGEERGEKTCIFPKTEETKLRLACYSSQLPPANTSSCFTVFIFLTVVCVGWFFNFEPQEFLPKFPCSKHNTYEIQRNREGGTDMGWGGSSLKEMNYVSCTGWGCAIHPQPAVSLPQKPQQRPGTDLNQVCPEMLLALPSVQHKLKSKSY